MEEDKKYVTQKHCPYMAEGDIITMPKDGDPNLLYNQTTQTHTCYDAGLIGILIQDGWIARHKEKKYTTKEIKSAVEEIISAWISNEGNRSRLVTDVLKKLQGKP